MKQLYNKARIHVENLVWYKSFKFGFYSLLRIFNRRIPLPSSVFKYDITGVYEEKHLEKFMYPRNGGCFVDVGANVGFWTMLVAKRGFEVHAFEPSPRPYQILKKRTRKYRNINVYPCALGDTNTVGTLMLHRSFSPLSTIGSFARNGGDVFMGRIQVPIRTLDSFNFSDVGLIKVDTEGYEVPVLLGAEKTILECEPRLIVEAHPRYKEKQETGVTDYVSEKRSIIELYEKLGYNWTVKYKRGFRCPNPQPHIIGEKHAKSCVSSFSLQSCRLVKKDVTVPR